MNIFMNYNFLLDGNAVDPFMTDMPNINKVKIQNGIYDHFNVTSDVESEYSTDVPTDWTQYTIMDCDFANNVNAGSLENITANVTSIRIKRREINSYDWITVKEVPVSSPEDFMFAFADYLAANNTEYEYAFVPVTNTVEGDYAVASVRSKFNGVFLCDESTAYKFMFGVEYGTTTTMQKVGTFEPFGRKYPIVVANSIDSYDSGSINGNVFPPQYYNDRVIDRQAIVRERDLLKKFLTNKRAKILKDPNGNYWLVCITGSPTTNYDNSYGMGVIKMGASWVEIGDANNAEDLYHAGLIPTAE